MEKLSALLKRKVAGIPVVYIAAALVAILVAVAIKIKPSVDVDADDEAQDDADTADGDAANGGQPVFVANPSMTPAGIADPATTDPVQVMDNTLWLKKGVEYLIQKQMASGGVAQAALQKYLDGQPMSYSEGVLRDAVIAQYGLPPEPPTSGGTSPKPATRQFTNFPGTHTVKGASDNTYGELAQLYYGRGTDPKTIDLLQAANLQYHGGPFPVGTRIKIPAYRTPKFYTATSATRTLSAIARKHSMAQARVVELNPKTKFPVKAGTRVRVS